MMNLVADEESEAEGFPGLGFGENSGTEVGVPKLKSGIFPEFLGLLEKS